MKKKSVLAILVGMLMILTGLMIVSLIEKTQASLAETQEECSACPGEGAENNPCSENSFTSWIKLYPDKVTLTPGESFNLKIDWYRTCWCPSDYFKILIKNEATGQILEMARHAEPYWTMCRSYCTESYTQTLIAPEDPGIYTVKVVHASGHGEGWCDHYVNWNCPRSDGGFRGYKPEEMTWDFYEMAVEFNITVIIPIIPDFWIDEIDPVQVVWNSDINGDNKVDLVAGKSTMIRVEIGMKNYETLDKQQLVEVRLTFDGADYIESRTIEQLEQNNRIEFYPAPPTTIGDQTITAIVDPENKIKESDENNNRNSVEITVKDTSGLYLVYFPVDRPITYFGYGPINMGEYSETVSQSGKFISATYPVAEGEFMNEKRDEKYYGNPIPCVDIPWVGKRCLGILDDAVSLWLWGELLTGTSADRSVGIVPEDYFGYHSIEDVKGVAFPGIKGVLVEGGYWTTTAHEIGHTYGLRLAEEEYMTNPPGNPANGFWVSEHREISNGICFMGYALPTHSFTYYDNRPIWICNEDYTVLFKEFRVDKTDPDVLLMSGIISKDGTIQLGKLYLVGNGTIDYIIPGDYSIQILDADGQVLTDIPFYTSFKMYIDPLGIIDTDFAGFTLTVPYPENASKIQIRHNDEMLIEINPNSKLLHDAVDSIPDHGFINNPDQRRNALHNKINAVEKMIEKGNYKGAVNKLKFDIKDKFVKWLIDDYQKETPEQFSKVEVIELVQKIIDRLATQ